MGFGETLNMDTTVICEEGKNTRGGSGNRHENVPVGSSDSIYGKVTGSMKISV